jgi:hypothetical protein
MESLEPTSTGKELRSLGLKHLRDRLLGQFPMAMRLGADDALVENPDV